MSERYPEHDQPTERRPAPLPETQVSLKPGATPTQRTPRPDLTRSHPPLPPEEPPEPRESGLYVPWWGFVLVILAVAAITCGMWYLVLSSRGVGISVGGPTPTPIFVVITSTPTLEGAGGEPSGSIPPTPTSTPTTQEPPTPTPTNKPTMPVSVGSRVTIVGTEGLGLNVRQGPGLGFDLIFVARDGEEFIVKDGPREVDGFIWWYITDPNDVNRFGWAVEEFMQVVP